MSNKKKDKKQLNPFLETVLLVAFAVAVVLITQKWVVKPFKVPSGSMIPELSIGQRIVVDRASEHLGWDPKIGDVIVFNPPRGASIGNDQDMADADYNGPQCGREDALNQGEICPESAGGQWKGRYFVKRVVGVPGDRIALEGNRVVRNGKLVESEPFIKSECLNAESVGATLSASITLKAGQYFTLGDNRCNSTDGRFWGPIERDWVVGRVFGSYWPPKKIGGVN